MMTICMIGSCMMTSLAFIKLIHATFLTWPLLILHLMKPTAMHISEHNMYVNMHSSTSGKFRSIFRKLLRILMHSFPSRRLVAIEQGAQNTCLTHT